MTNAQMFLKIRLPFALPSIMAGINQCLMMAFGMVVIAGIVGSGGLGETIYKAIRTLDIAKSIDAAIAIVILTIVIDRLTQTIVEDGKGQAMSFASSPRAAWLRARRRLAQHQLPWPLRRCQRGDRGGARRLADGAAVPAGLCRGPRSPPRSPGRCWAGAPRSSPPSPLASATSSTPGTSRWKRSRWSRCRWPSRSRSRVPIGILAARRPRLEAALRPVLDVMQTVPPWVYLIPAVMIFSLGRVPAIIATIVYGILADAAVDDARLQAGAARPDRARPCHRRRAAHHTVQDRGPLPPSRRWSSASTSRILLSLAMVVLAGLVAPAAQGGG